MDSSMELYQGASKAYADLDMGVLDMYRAQSTDEFLSRVKRVNTVCCRGMQLEPVGKDGEYVPTQLNTGHWGPNVYNGCKGVRCGDNAFLKEVDISHSTPM